jgi:hypothetical protein
VQAGAVLTNYSKLSVLTFQPIYNVLLTIYNLCQPYEGEHENKAYSAQLKWKTPFCNILEPIGQIIVDQKATAKVSGTSN